MALIEREEGRDHGDAEHDHAHHLPGEALQEITEPGREPLDPRIGNLGAPPGGEAPEQLFREHADCEDHGDADHRHQQHARGLAFRQLAGEKRHHHRHLRPVADAFGPHAAHTTGVGLELVDHADGLAGCRGALGRRDLVELRQQQRAHLIVAEPRHQVAHRLRAERFRQGHRLAICFGPGRHAGDLRVGGARHPRQQPGHCQHDDPAQGLPDPGTRHGRLCCAHERLLARAPGRNLRPQPLREQVGARSGSSEPVPRQAKLRVVPPAVGAPLLGHVQARGTRRCETHVGKAVAIQESPLRVVEAQRPRQAGPQPIGNIGLRTRTSGAGDVIRGTGLKGGARCLDPSWLGRASSQT